MSYNVLHGATKCYNENKQEAREEVLKKLADLQMVPAQPGPVFCQYHVKLFLPDCLQHLLKVGAVHVQPGKSIVLENSCHTPALFLAIAAQKFPLVLDTGAGTAQIVILKTAVNSGSHLFMIRSIKACLSVCFPSKRIGQRSKIRS